MAQKRKSRESSILKHVSTSAVAISDAVVNFFAPVAPLQIFQSMRNSYSGIKEELFNEKLERFLMETATVTKEEREQFVKSLQDDSTQFFKRLWTVIDRIDEAPKCELLGKLFTATMQGKVETQDFLKLASIIEKNFYDDIISIIKPTEENGPMIGTGMRTLADSVIEKQLVAMGLLNEKVNLNDKIVGIGRQARMSYTLSRLGQVFKDNCGK